VSHSVDLNDLQRVVSQYVEQYNLLVAAGPLTAASITKIFIRNKLVNIAIVGSGVWFATQELSGPALRLIQDQFGYLDSLMGIFR
jgi:hypothetical protein